MPKVRDMRKEKAATLLRRIKEGPSFSGTPFHDPFTPEEAARQYKLWADSWIVEQVSELVPELRAKRE
jgi:hypothetical protein